MAEATILKEKAEGRWDASVNVGYMRQNFGYDLRGLTANGGTRPIQDVFHYVGAGVSITLPVRNQNQGNIAAAQASTLAAQRRMAFRKCVVQFQSPCDELSVRTLGLVDRDAQTRLRVRPNDPPRLLDCESLLHHILTPRHVFVDRLADGVARLRKAELERRGGAHRPLRVVRRERDAVRFGERRDPPRLAQSATVRDVELAHLARPRVE